MAYSVPTGDALLFLLCQLLMSRKSFIWIALAVIAEVPLVVGVSLSRVIILS